MKKKKVAKKKPTKKKDTKMFSLKRPKATPRPRPDYFKVKKGVAPAKAARRVGDGLITFAQFCTSKGMRPNHVEGFRAFCKGQGIDASPKAMIERNGLESVYLAYGGK